jgi:secreted PhoX family phosphatase
MSGEIRRFLVGPRGCEITGMDFTPDGRTLFVNVQHPGEDGMSSNWPDFRTGGKPRSATVAIRKIDGGIIGT